MKLNDRIEALGRNVAKRELSHSAAIALARTKAEELHRVVESAIGRFNEAVAEQAPYLEVDLSATRVDDKHLHSVEFDLERGRHRAVVTVKSKGEVTLVGPFRSGKEEGPCRSFPVDANEEIEAALGDFLERFLEEAVTP